MAALALCGAEKTFTMHLRGGMRLPVVAGVEFSVEPGECVVLAGPSGAGKSSILRMIWGTYRCDRGAILVRDGAAMVDVAAATAREILRLRSRVIASVSQFLRVVPRVPALDVVAEPLGRAADEEPRAAAEAMLRRLNVPERLWSLPPATFSGGEQQRINIARGFLPERPILLLDEPTASLDAANRARVVELIGEKKRRGTAVVAVVHDDDVRTRIADRIVDVTQFTKPSEP
ncbi:MAG: phosphonate C-P lyase system protein PhnL [Rhodoplanes sp.]|uniref:phosphonate C-P lyase system protein PhnL n=1 Tax=Rhodoplanes sp. TaxID=1968906 RepID=UPI0017A44C86|nr:phosphonate C-P lyase system protein PhnL [Rhodoplanes sp.]NVO16220.1 phosphonate C-P lyase system protein PhnL [Rhodoplanes sp.]